jgi:hypothetical protein
MPSRTRPSTARTYLRDIEPDWLAGVVARNFVEYVNRVCRLAFGDREAALRQGPPRGGEDDGLLDLPVARIARRLCRYARSGAGADADQAEELVKRYCSLLAERVRGAVPVYGSSFRGRDELLLADMRSRGVDESDGAFAEMAEVLLATKARIYLARGEAIALRELAALASRPVNAVRRNVQGADFDSDDLVSWDELRAARPTENRGVRVAHDAACDFLRAHKVPGFVA